VQSPGPQLLRQTKHGRDIALPSTGYGMIDLKIDPALQAGDSLKGSLKAAPTPHLIVLLGIGCVQAYADPGYAGKNDLISDLGSDQSSIAG